MYVKQIFCCIQENVIDKDKYIYGEQTQNVL